MRLPSIMRVFGLLALVGAVAVAAQGCAAIGLSGAAAGIAAIQGGTGAVVKAGTEYGSNGVIYRTFAVPADQVDRATFEALQQLEIEVSQVRTDSKGVRLRADAHGRRVDVRVEPLTPAMSSLRLVVKRGVVGRDRATASEILTRVEDVLHSETSTAASPASCDCARDR